MKSRKKIRVVLVILCFGLPAAILFQNCSSGFEAHDSILSMGPQEQSGPDPIPIIPLTDAGPGLNNTYQPTGDPQESGAAPIIYPSIPTVATLNVSSTTAPQSIYLKDYFSLNDQAIQLRKYDGAVYSTYRFQNHMNNTDFDKLYEKLFQQGKPTRIVTWQKSYREGCTSTYGVLQFDQDNSVREIGDWYADDGCKPSRAIGYRGLTNKESTGLYWSPPGIFSVGKNFLHEMQIWGQAAPGASYVYHGQNAYSDVTLVESLESYQPYGGKKYNNVIRIIMYHGTKNTITPKPDNICTTDQNNWEYGKFYRHRQGYTSYGMEFYLAKGQGIIQEAFLFNESEYWGPNMICKGLAISKPGESAQARSNLIKTWIWTKHD